MSGARQAGLRLQIVLALAGLMLLAFVPLFFAVASLTQATVAGAREQGGRVLGRAIATHVADAYASRTPGAVGRAIEQLESDIAASLADSGVPARLLRS